MKYPECGATLDTTDLDFYCYCHLCKKRWTSVYVKGYWEGYNKAMEKQNV